MRVERRKDSLPRWAKDIFPGVPVTAFELIQPTGPRHKVCFFKTKKDLAFAWKRLYLLRSGFAQNKMDMRCRGFVHQCWQVRERVPGPPRMCVDARYASIICLLVPGLNLEVCAHEAVHAGLANLRRVKRNPDASVNDMDDEELLAYPTGWIASQIIRVAQKEGFLTP